jgi:hypothetical protein
MYILDFRGRVTQASIRNFQAVRAENGTSSLSFVCVCVCVCQLYFSARLGASVLRFKFGRSEGLPVAQLVGCLGGLANWRGFRACACVAEDDIVIQFGKVGDNSYTLDFAHPVSAFQAFAVSLTAFEG